MAHDPPQEFFQGDLPENPTHGDILLAVKAVLHDKGLRIIADQRRDTQLQEIKRLVEGLVAAIGTEGKDEYGKPIGTGLTGRMMRAELQWEWWSRMREKALGALLAATLAAAVIWWLIMPTLQKLFHGAPS